jgi:RNA 2',3'-cyclic 3'-phosphodiesterase
MSATIRSFIAIELPQGIMASLKTVQDEMKSKAFKVKWVRPENIHLTLKFLGNIDAADTAKISGAMRNAVRNQKPFVLVARGAGVFPGIRRPKVVWVGLSGRTRSLVDLQGALDANLADIGYPKEPRPFKGHLTIGRIKRAPDSKTVAEMLQARAGFVSDEFKVNQICLFKSTLHPTGAVYSKLQEIPF